MITVEIHNQQATLDVSSDGLRDAVELVISNEGLGVADVSLAIVDDETIHELNRRYLSHDYPTDVLSFLLDRGAAYLEGEIVVSAETAKRVAADYGWQPHDELLLYVVHGTLHLVGYDDQTAEQRSLMQSKEAEILQDLGILPADHRRPSSVAAPPDPTRGVSGR